MFFSANLGERREEKESILKECRQCAEEQRQNSVAEEEVFSENQCESLRDSPELHRMK